MNRPLHLLLCFFSGLLAQPAPAAGGDDVEAGFKLSIKYCSRCHVIGEYNRMGGIGNSPSFPWMTMLPDYAERLKTFYARRPHPNFTRVPGYAKWSDGPPYVPEFTITHDEIDAIVRYVQTLRVAQ